MADLSKRRRDVSGKLLPRTGYEEVPSEKPCSRCEQSKPLEDFPPDKRRIDGRTSRCRACCAVVASERRAADPESARAYDRGEARKARRNARLSERRATDRRYAERVDAVRKRRRELAKYGITTDVLYERDHALCHICLRHVDREDAEPDHVVPMARGGANEPTNIKLAHRSCNRRKSDLLDWSHIREAA